MNTFTNVVDYKISILKLIAFLYTKDKQHEKEARGNIPFTET